jgi:hypothetical protein
MTIMAGALIDIADFSDSGWLDDNIIWNTGWEDYQPTESNNHFEYRRIGSMVYLRGLVRRITSSFTSGTETMFTLPDGFRPSRNVITSGMTSGTWVTGAASAGTAHTHNVISSSTSGPVLRVTVNATGTVQIVAPAQVTIAIDNWVTVSEVSFLVDL